MIIHKDGRILVADLLSDGMDSVKLILVMVMINIMVKGYTETDFQICHGWVM